jgi:CHAT domain-containing protein
MDMELKQALETVAHADRPEDVEAALAKYPTLADEEFLEELDRWLDEIEQKRSEGNWWDLTRARVLLGGYRDGDLNDALYRCWTRDLLPLGPEDVRNKVKLHPDLLTKRADDLLRYWASQQQQVSHVQQAEQIELRRQLLRQIALEHMQTLAAAAEEQEREFHRTGDAAALNSALATKRYLAHDPKAPFAASEVQASHIQGVCRLLQLRFRVGGARVDVDDAIVEAEKALSSISEEDFLYRPLLSELGNALNLRFREFGNSSDIARAIQIFETLAEPIDVPLRDPDDELTPQVNLAVGLLDRYYHFYAAKDLERSIELLEAVVSRTPSESKRRPLRINNLCSALYIAFRDRADQKALLAAIPLQRELMRTSDAFLRVHAMTGLARSLDAAAQIGHASVDESASLFREACQIGLKQNLGTAMWAGMTWGRISWERGDLGSAAEAYSYSTTGARLLFRRQAGESSQRVRLSQFREAAPRAAFALASQGKLEEAVVAFELSRTQLLMQAIDRGETLRAATDLDRDVLITAFGETSLAPPSVDLSEITSAAPTQALIYLIYTERGGLALVIQNGCIDHVPLPNLTADSVVSRVRSHLAGVRSEKPLDPIVSVDETTQWVWDAIMGPVVASLRGTEAAVIVPGGLLGLMPLHAAWTPANERACGRQYALDDMVFSYAPSARALAITRNRTEAASGLLTSSRALVVADPAPTSEPALPFSDVEAEIVKWHFNTAKEYPGDKASIQEVCGSLPGVEHVHLACHGFANLQTPLDSGVILANDQALTVRMIRELKLNARLAVLSACETGVSGTELPDEVIAMPTGLLQAGVAGTIASMWSVADLATALLFVEFYRGLCSDHLSPAAALRGAQQWIRDTSLEEKAWFLETGAGRWLPADTAQRLCSSIRAMPGRDLSYPFWWGAFAHFGI